MKPIGGAPGKSWAMLLCLALLFAPHSQAGQFTANSNVTSVTNRAEPKFGQFTNSSPTPPYKYSLRVGGPNSFVGLTNLPELNRVHLSFKRFAKDDENHPGFAVFGFTNQEPCGILVWNVRVQVPSKGRGTDGQGWDTVYDDYPTVTPKYNFDQYPSGGYGEVMVDPPHNSPWRVCLLYSKAMPQPNPQHGSFSGNYEIVSVVQKE